MYKKIVTVLMIGFAGALYSQGLGEIKKGDGAKVKFNRMSLVIPKGWNYSVNPKARPGTDQLQLYSDDTNRTILITLTKAREDISLPDAVRQGGITMVQRGLSFPRFKDCFVGGSGQSNEIWGRKGIVTKFNFYKNDEQNEDDIVMRIYHFGENLSSSKEVLFIVAFIIGEEKKDTEDVIKSIDIL